MLRTVYLQLGIRNLRAVRGVLILQSNLWLHRLQVYRIVAKYNIPSNLAIFDIGKAVASDSYIDYNLD